MSTMTIGPSGAADMTSFLPAKLVRTRPLFDPEIVRRALKDSFLKLNPAIQFKNPVMLSPVFKTRVLSVPLTLRSFEPSPSKKAAATSPVKLADDPDSL